MKKLVTVENKDMVTAFETLKVKALFHFLKSLLEYNRLLFPAIAVMLSSLRQNTW